MALFAGVALGSVGAAALTHAPPLMTTVGSLRTASAVRMVVESPRAARWKPGEVAPAHLTGALAGDAGFDPFLLAALANKAPTDLVTGGFPNRAQREIILANQTPKQQLEALEWMREAELKHARLAMLAAVGWPLAELINPWLSTSDGRAPSVLNGGLGDGVVPFFLILSAMGAAVLENKYEERVSQQRQLGKPYVAGDFAFDPLKLSEEEGAYQQKYLRSSELFNGRLAMLAITGMSMQEFLWHRPVVEQTPFFFGR